MYDEWKESVFKKNNEYCLVDVLIEGDYSSMSLVTHLNKKINRLNSHGTVNLLINKVRCKLYILSESLAGFLDAFIICYDVTNRASFSNAIKRISEIQDTSIEKRNHDTASPILLVGVKINLADKSQITYDEAKKCADDFKINFIEINKNNKTDIVQTFVMAARMQLRYANAYRAERSHPDFINKPPVFECAFPSVFEKQEHSALQNLLADLVDDLDRALNHTLSYRTVMINDDNSVKIEIKPGVGPNKLRGILKQLPALKAIQENYELTLEVGGTAFNQTFQLVLKHKSLNHQLNNNNNNLTETHHKKENSQFPVIKKEEQGVTVLKMLMVGDRDVPKSDLLLKFSDDSFTPSFITTIGIDFKIRHISIDNQRYKLQIWDTAGQERFRTITTAYYRDANVVLLCYDVTNEKSFTNLISWLNNAASHGKGIPVLLVGIKSDARKNVERVISYEQAKQFAEENSLDYMETDVLNLANVEEVFMQATLKALGSMPVANEKNESINASSQSITTPTKPSSGLLSIFGRQKSVPNPQQNNNNNNNNTPQYFDDLLSYLLRKYEKVKHLQPTPEKPATDKAWRRYTQRLLHYAAIHKFMAGAIESFAKHEKIADVIHKEFQQLLISGKLPVIDGSTFAGIKTSSEEYLTLFEKLRSISTNELMTQFQALEARLSGIEKNYPIETIYVQLGRDLNHVQNINTAVSLTANVSSDGEDEEIQNTSYDPYDERTGTYDL